VYLPAWNLDSSWVVLFVKKLDISESSQTMLTQAASRKPQAASRKPQAASRKPQAAFLRGD
jgi:hypothetical protein